MEIEIKGIQKMIASIETVLSLLEDEENRHCYHLGMVKLRLHLHLLRELIEFDQTIDGEN